MAIIQGHKFHSKHGFSGSANPSGDYSVNVPGYKRGGSVDEKIKFAVREHENQQHEGEHAKIELKCGGKV